MPATRLAPPAPRCQLHQADVFTLETPVNQLLRMREAARMAIAFLHLAEQLGLTRLARTRLSVNASDQTLVAQLMEGAEGE